MRIRKRLLTTSSSSLPHSQDLSSSPPTLRPPPPPPPHEELHHHKNYPLCDPPNHSLPKQESTKPRSDLQLIIVKGTNGWIWSTGAARDKRDDCMHPITSTQALQDDPILEGKGEAPSSCAEEDKISAPTAIRERNKKVSSSGASACERMSVVSTPSSSHHQGGKWCNGVSPQIYNKSTCIDQLQEQDQGQVLVHKNELMNKDNSNEIKIKKQRKKADKVSAMMAGSRCSRVNGRGWRCCQETLVGYSLCEHHLGKGRLRNKIIKSTTTSEKQQGTTTSTLLSSKPIMITKEAKKIGIVKARSLRSLLGQTQTHHASSMVLPVVLDSQSIITL